MNINHIQEGERGYFVAAEDLGEVGRIVYRMAGPAKLIIEHTEVDPAYEGNGIGKRLVYAVVDYARNHHIGIIPICSFAKALFDKTPEIQDVLI